MSELAERGAELMEFKAKSLPPLAFSTLGCPDWSFEDLVAKGSGYGYHGVEIRLLQRETDLLARPEFQSSELALRRRQLGDANFQVCGLASSVRFHDLDPAERTRQIAVGRAYCDLAAELGAKFVRVFGDVLETVEAESQISDLKFPIENQKSKIKNPIPQSHLASLRWIADGLQALGEYAETVDVDVLIETHGDFCRTPMMVALMQHIDCPAVGVLWDTHHPWRFHHEPLAETFEWLRPWIRHSHWKDSVARSVPKIEQQSAAAVAAAQLAQQTNPEHQSADYVLFGGGEFPARECLQLLKPWDAAGHPGSLRCPKSLWYCLEWEKMWHPELEEPDVALRLFPQKFLDLWTTVINVDICAMP